MQLTLNGMKEKEKWEEAGVALPLYNIEEMHKRTIEKPQWIHFGIGNIFRIFIGGIAEKLIEEGEMDKGIICAETFDYDVVDRIYEPYDNLGLNVILHNDGRVTKKVIGSLAEAIKVKASDSNAWKRLKEIFVYSGLQMVSFTITEKGYALTGANGKYFGFVNNDIERGPNEVTSAMAIVTSMLWERFKAGAMPITLVSMDNCAQNGKKLHDSVKTIAQEWNKRGFVSDEFIRYIDDDEKVAFPWTMIDKITPRPSEKIANELEMQGIEAMQPVITSKQTYIAPFANAEEIQYLVIEDKFVNGRPKFERAGVYMTDRETVNKAEKMKVTACLNPIHTSLGPYGCMLGYTLFSDQMKDPDSFKLAQLLGAEGMRVVPDPGIISPKEFFEECIYKRFPNPFLGDTVQRLAGDCSQCVGIRFGETLKAYLEQFGKESTDKLIAIPLSIAGWIRYLLGVDDEGNTFELSPDPMIEELQGILQGVRLGEPDSLQDKAKIILSNENIFHINLYEAGVGEKTEELIKEELAGFGAVRRTLHKYMFE